MKAEQVLIFFFGLFWAQALRASSKFRPFHTASNDREAWLRFGLSIVILNLLPVLLLSGLFFLARSVFGERHPADFCALIFGAFSSMSVFALPRLMHACVASSPVRKTFYSDREWAEDVSPELHRYWELDDRKLSKCRNRLNPPGAQPIGGHLWPALGYLVLFPSFGLSVVFWIPRLFNN